MASAFMASNDNNEYDYILTYASKNKKALNPLKLKKV